MKLTAQSQAAPLCFGEASTPDAGSGRCTQPDSAQDRPCARLGLPKLGGGRDLRRNTAWPQAGSVDILDRPERRVALRLRSIEYLRAVRRADIAALSVQRGRIVNLEEEFRQIAIAEAADKTRFGMRSMVAIGRVRHIAARGLLVSQLDGMGRRKVTLVEFGQDDSTERSVRRRGGQRKLRALRRGSFSLGQTA